MDVDHQRLKMLNIAHLLEKVDNPWHIVLGKTNKNLSMFTNLFESKKHFDKTNSFLTTLKI